MKKAIKSFFYRGNDFQPPYFWITVLMILVVVSFIMKLLGIGKLSDNLVISAIGFVASWVGLYNWNRKNGNNKH